jgi:restriction system protein
MSEIPIPTGFFDPILRVLATHGQALRRRDAYEAVAELAGITPEQRAERLPSGTALRYRHRIGWGLNMLKNAGLARSVGHGHWEITDAGRALLAEREEGLTATDQREIARRAARTSVAADESGESAAHQPRVVDEQTPDEQIDQAVRQINASVYGELLDRVLDGSPDFFEVLVLDLLHATGYGTSREHLEHVGRTGDGGIDGIISLDKLGLEKVYVQAKRWQGNVGRAEIQSFKGALDGRRARKGVFITTSDYTREAREYAEAVSDSIVLIDGKRLAQLMVEHGVGVSYGRTIRIPKVDGDYFDEG